MPAAMLPLNPTWAGFNVEDAAQRNLAPLGQMNEGNHTVALARVQMAIHKNAAQLAAQNRTKELQEQERLRAVEEAATHGIPVKSNMSLEDVANATRDFMQNQARVKLSILNDQRSDLNDRMIRARNQVMSAASKIGVGSPEQQKLALQDTLNDSSITKFLTADEAEKLKSALNSSADPSVSVQRVVEELKAAHGGIGDIITGPFSSRSAVFRTTAERNAASLAASFKSNLAARIDPQIKPQMEALMKNYTDTTVELQGLMSKAWDTAGAIAGVLPKEEVAGFRKDWKDANPFAAAGPVQPPGAPDPNRNHLLAAAAGPGGQQPPIPAPDAASSAAPPAPAAPSPGEAFDQGGLPAFASNVAGRIPPGAGSALGNPAAFAAQHLIASGANGAAPMDQLAQQLYQGAFSPAPQAGPVDQNMALTNRARMLMNTPGNKVSNSDIGLVRQYLQANNLWRNDTEFQKTVDSVQGNEVYDDSMKRIQVFNQVLRSAKASVAGGNPPNPTMNPQAATVPPGSGNDSTTN